MSDLIQHPPLPAGVNSAFWAGDEFNGGGYHDWAAPTLYDYSEVFQPGVMLPEMFEHSDICIGGECREATVPKEPRDIRVKEAA